MVPGVNLILESFVRFMNKEFCHCFCIYFFIIMPCIIGITLIYDFFHILFHIIVSLRTKQKTFILFPFDRWQK